MRGLRDSVTCIRHPRLCQSKRTTNIHFFTTFWLSPFNWTTQGERTVKSASSGTTLKTFRPNVEATNKSEYSTEDRPKGHDLPHCHIMLIEFEQFVTNRILPITLWYFGLLNFFSVYWKKILCLLYIRDISPKLDLSHALSTPIISSFHFFIEGRQKEFAHEK